MPDPDWKRYGYSSLESYVESKAGANPVEPIECAAEGWRCDYQGGAGRRPCRAILFAKEFPYDGPATGTCPYYDHNLGCPHHHQPGKGTRVLIVDPDSAAGCGSTRNEPA